MFTEDFGGEVPFEGFPVEDVEDDVFVVVELEDFLSGVIRRQRLMSGKAASELSMLLIVMCLV